MVLLRRGVPHDEVDVVEMDSLVGAFEREGRDHCVAVEAGPGGVAAGGG